MTTQLQAPLDLRDEPEPIYIGESYKPEITFRDGRRTAANPLGALVDISSAAITCVLRINGVEAGGADLERSTANASEAEKVDDNTVLFKVSDAVTALWSPGVYEAEVEYRNAGATPTDIVLCVLWRIEVRKKPSAS